MWVSDGVSGRSNGLPGCTKPGLVHQARLCGTAGWVRYANQVGSLHGGEERRRGEGERKTGKEEGGEDRRRRQEEEG